MPTNKYMNVFEILLIIIGAYAITLLINSLCLEVVLEELQHKCFIYKISALNSETSMSAPLSSRTVSFD